MMIGLFYTYLLVAQLVDVCITLTMIKAIIVGNYSEPLFYNPVSLH